MYNLPQEIEVWYIIPAIRKEFAKVLSRKHKLSFDRIGKILGVSKSAISQYISKKRANLVKFPKEITREIEKSALLLFQNENLAVKEILRILNLIKKTKCSCGVCKKYNKGILKQCGMRGEY